MGDLKGLLLGQLVDFLAAEAGFADDGTHADVGVDQVDSCVALRVQHFLEGEDVVGNTVLLEVEVFDGSHAQLLSGLLVLFRLQ